ncbi:winged helix-turn-helix transcriptional regulator [Pedobacter mucosus]|uniref:winged helix-turn-helix transcriptional regulator n=1 Tax=Pedobacter mucosus TaxID=2895286 RepID=UPI001EE4A833|nr:helix-turn-helix domain-containing protein [Pedobacter mucosus]UKT65973.1 helix-turn-helix transcriptional regulator [Pedobacter mucosus]
MDKKRYIQKIKAIQDTMFVLGGKWRLPVIISIYYGNRRFNDIVRTVPGITNRVLSKELKHLEENFLIRRTVTDDYAVRIEYSITEYCVSLNEVVRPMENWGKKHRKVVAGREPYSDNTVEASS